MWNRRIALCDSALYQTRSSRACSRHQTARTPSSLRVQVDTARIYLRGTQSSLVQLVLRWADLAASAKQQLGSSPRAHLRVWKAGELSEHYASSLRLQMIPECSSGLCTASPAHRFQPNSR